MSRFGKIFSALVLSLSLACFGCGGDGDDGDGGGSGNGGGGGGGGSNVEACESYNQWLQDCDDDYQGTLNCDNFSAVSCDVSDYFNCLQNKASCDNGTINPGNAQECQSKAQCN